MFQWKFSQSRFPIMIHLWRIINTIIYQITYPGYHFLLWLRGWGPNDQLFCFSTDFDEIWCKIFFWPPETKYAVRFSKFVKGPLPPPVEGGGGTKINKKIIYWQILMKFGIIWFLDLLKPNLKSDFWNFERGPLPLPPPRGWGRCRIFNFFVSQQILIKFSAG